MAKKVILNADVFTVPLNKLALSPKNVRKTCAAAEIEELAASIAAPGRGLIQNLGVSEQVDDEGTPTGMWEVVAGGRRFRALALLAERKRLAASAPIPLPPHRGQECGGRQPCRERGPEGAAPCRCL